MALLPDGSKQYKSKTAAVRRAGRYGQGWLPYIVSVEQVRTTVRQLGEYAREAGRNPDGIIVGLNNSWLVKDTYEEALKGARLGGVRYGRDLSERVSQVDLLGTPEDIIRRMNEYIDAGVTHFSCNWMGDPGEVQQQMEIVAKKVMPYFR